MHNLLHFVRKYWWLSLCVFVLAACDMNMRDQPRHEALEGSDFFDDGRSARPIEPNTVARGNLRIDRHLYEGVDENGDFVETFPFPVTSEVLDQGQEQYEIFCTPCHDGVGNGRGKIVQRGMPQPSSFHDDRLLESANGYYYSVITDGFGRMYSYSSRIKPEDRWAIIAYIRALQLSQNATVNDLAPETLELLESEEEVPR